MRILVVDDERAIRFSLAELLESEGHEVREAEHAPAALAALDGGRWTWTMPPGGGAKGPGAAIERAGALRIRGSWLHWCSTLT